MFKKRNLTKLKIAIFAPTIAWLLLGCEDKKVTFRGEVPLFAQNENNLSVKSDIKDNVQVIEYTFYKLPPARTKRILPDVVPPPKPYQFSPNEIKHLVYISNAKLREERLNNINRRLKNLSDTPLPHEPDQMTKIDTDTTAYEKRHFGKASNSTN
ncbi:hypothetical protein MUB04_14660 [Acinetobacter indicus]|uniref:hypothetical protein n=1 Tax=Acinetobacter TaxID=469 RepID=UPI0015D30B1B|nr:MULTISPECIES: hypothetical protein [Acinetobacter]MCP0917774.1 hypothetical protein [Acinetobacter indicus]